VTRVRAARDGSTYRRRHRATRARMSTPGARTTDATRAERELTAEELSSFVQNLLTQMQTRFQTMSDAIITKIDDMGERIEALEKSVNDIATTNIGSESGAKK